MHCWAESWADPVAAGVPGVACVAAALGWVLLVAAGFAWQLHWLLAQQEVAVDW